MEKNYLDVRSFNINFNLSGPGSVNPINDVSEDNMSYVISNYRDDISNYILIRFKNDAMKFDYFNIYKTNRIPLERATGVIISGLMMEMILLNCLMGNIVYDGTVSRNNKLNDNFNNFMYYKIEFTNSK